MPCIRPFWIVPETTPAGRGSQSGLSFGPVKEARFLFFLGRAKVVLLLFASGVLLGCKYDDA
jgi:hypothetical protein